MPENANTDARTVVDKKALLKRLLQERAGGTGSRRAPVSFSQQRMWLLQQLDPAATTYNLFYGVRLRGALHVPFMEAALAGVVRRHEALRTTFEAVGDQLEQVIHAEQTIRLDLVDLSPEPASLRLPKAIELALAERHQPFDLSRGPLLRARLHRLSGDEHILSLVLHHIVADGWSVGILIRELGRLYDAQGEGGSDPLPVLPFQFADFAVHQRQLLAGENLRFQLEYWKRQLAGLPPALDLPLDGRRQSPPTRKAETRSLQVDAAQLDALKKLSREAGVTPFVVVLAAIELLLQRTCGQDDIVVGSPVAARTTAHAEELIGFFVNMLVLRTDLSGNPTFRELLGRTKAVTSGAFAHQDLPFERLLEELNPGRDPGTTPLFQVYVNMLSFQNAAPAFAGLEADLLPPQESEANFDLTFYVMEESGALKFLCVFRDGLFSGARIEEMLCQLEQVLTQALAEPDRPIGDLSLVTSKSRPVLPDPGLPLITTTATPGTLVCRNLAASGRRIAISGPEGTWTFEQLDARANQVARLLLRAGLGRGEIVAIHARRDPLLVCALLGVLRAGAAFAILDPAYPDASLAARWRAAAPRGLILLAGAGEPGAELAAAMEDTGLRVRLSLSNATFSGSGDVSTADGFPEPGPDDLAYIAFTSGTTGGVKAIAGTHGPVAHFLDWQQRTFGLGPADRFTMLSGLAHDPLLRDVFAPLWAGGTLCIPEPDVLGEAGELADWMKSQGATVTHLTPALAQFLGLTMRPERIDSLRYAFFGGDVLRADTVSQLRRLAPNATCVNFYGATETPQAMSYQLVPPGNSDLRDRIPIGRGIEGVQLLIVNASGRLAGVGELGEIVVRTPWLSAGYRADEELTRERFTGNPLTGAADDRVYRTRDLGRYLPDGTVEFAGRRDTQVKLRGFRIELGEIEAELRQHPAVAETVVALREDLHGDGCLVSYVVSRAGQAADSAELRAFLKKRLPDHAVPSAFVMLDRLPVTPNGKIDRQALPMPSRDAADGTAGTYVAPRNHIEIVMAGIWADVLGVKPVSVVANFFELGGHSLSATRMIARLKAALQIDLPLKNLFVEPTIAGLSASIRFDESTQTYRYVGEVHRWGRLVPAQPRGSQIPLFLVAGYMDPNDTLRVLSNLIPHLGLDQPLYGFQPRWLDGQSPSYASVDEVVREFVAELRAFRPEGPYLLGGDCVQGLVALEMARELQRQGAEVALLVLYDTERPTKIRDLAADVRHACRRLAHIGGTIAKIVGASRQKRAEILRYLYQRKRKAFQVEKFGESETDRVYRLRMDYRRMLYRHRVKKYPGKITLIVNELFHRRDKDLGWSGVAAGGVEIHVTPGDHQTRYVSHSKDFAALLSVCLQTLRAQAARDPATGGRP